MGPLVVVAFDEVIEPGLLLQEVFGGRFGGLQLQGSDAFAHVGRSAGVGRA